MRRYVLDTGILVHYARQSATYQSIEQNEGLTQQDCIPFISVVTYGEYYLSQFSAIGERIKLQK